MRTFHKTKRVALALSAFLLALPITFTSARACGPDFPNAYLADGSVSLLSAPEGYFTAEIIKLIPKSDKYKDFSKAQGDAIERYNKIKKDNELTETGEVRDALAKAGASKERIEALAAEAEKARSYIFAKDWSKTLTFSPDMPAEFALYLKGAYAYWKGDYDEARTQWKAVLDLPEKDRKHRTVMAAYMIGRTYVPEVDTKVGLPDRGYSNDEAKANFAEGITWLQKSRTYAFSGFEDLSDLSTASLGWEARAHFMLGEYAQAFHLYIEQCVAYGVPEGSAILSLRSVSRAALLDVAVSRYDKSNGANLDRVAKDELSRRIVTLYVLARFGSNRWDDDADKLTLQQARTWADALEKAKITEMSDADQLAWVAYQGGYFELAKKWANLASADSVPGNWIRAKLALRAGDTPQAEALLVKVTSSPELTGKAQPVAWADLGNVRMNRSEYAEALEAFVSGGHWEDSAYIAERVLTLDELKTYVDASSPSYAKKTGPDYNYDLPNNIAYDSPEGQQIAQRSDANFARESVRYLFARRLARANQFENAVKYMPEVVAANYKRYVSDVRTGFDATLPNEKRATAFWNAALNARQNGMEMLGTELRPDYFIWGGSFQYSGIEGARTGQLRLEGGPGAPTDDELKRVASHKIPERRFHYRYRAAELGMWAASLMPNDTEETANVLVKAGGWIKDRDAAAAKPFYQALVIRCPHTELGKAAIAQSWLPDSGSEPEGDQEEHCDEGAACCH